MLNLPKDGDRVMVWPKPGHLIQAGVQPIGDGGMSIPEGGREINWTPFAYRQLLHGEILLSDPNGKISAEKAAADEATAEKQEAIEKKEAEAKQAAAKAAEDAKKTPAAKVVKTASAATIAKE